MFLFSISARPPWRFSHWKTSPATYQEYEAGVFDIDPVAEPAHGAYDAIVVAVGHREFVALGAAGIRAFGKPLSVVYDVKYVLPRDAVDGRL